MVFVKICGITNLDDALASIQAGADALGFNFYRGSKRFIEPANAARIIEQLPPSALTVGVFVNEGGPSEVKRIVTEFGIGAIQLHGEESAAYCSALNGKFIIKAFRVSPGFEPLSIAEYPATAIMLDSFVPGMDGGTGETFNWNIARRLNAKVAKLFLAGGLSHQNVGEAIKKVRPYGVDACTRLETSPGRKNADLVEKFVKAAKNAF